MIIKKRIVHEEISHIDFGGTGQTLGEALEDEVRSIFREGAVHGGRPYSIEVEWDEHEASALHHYFKGPDKKPATKAPARAR